ncbi:MAG TPA: hypothetical protein DHW36_15975 [Thalassospira sp.]|nr:hypothetical protein [Thalassospira sp.]
MAAQGLAAQGLAAHGFAAHGLAPHGLVPAPGSLTGAGLATAGMFAVWL